MEFLIEYGLFLAQTVTIVIAIIVVIGSIVSASSKGRSNEEGHIEVTHLNERFDKIKEAVQEQILSKAELKALAKEEKKAHKEAEKKEKAALKAKKKGDVAEDTDEKGRVFVVDFDGDMHAHQVDMLREEISAILSVADKKDEVVVRLESPGGVVHGYGLAASQLMRVREREIPLIVAVDMVAASGGYMMACVANKIIAAPFAIVGSIGVLAQLPNFNRLLKKHDIDYEQFTAGEFKRTVTVFGENTDKARQKFQEELEETHVLFKSFVSGNRPSLEISKVATGEHWYGKQAVDLNLIDEISTSDDYLLQLSEERDIYKVEYLVKKSLGEKIGLSFATAWQSALAKIAKSLAAR